MAPRNRVTLITEKDGAGLTVVRKGELLTATAAEIQEHPTGYEERFYVARYLVQATFPHDRPDDWLPEWTRASSGVTLSLRPGWRTDPQTGKRKCLGYPFGVIPRLILYFLTTEAVRRKDRKIFLGHSLNSFLTAVGLSPATGGGPRSDAARLRDQLIRLLGSTISLDSATEFGRSRWMNMSVTSEGELWFDEKNPDQPAFWSSYLELGEKFYDAIIAAPVPLDLRALRMLKQSALALDYYGWLSLKIFHVNRRDEPSFVPWSHLAKQFGASYKDTKDFKRRSRGVLEKIRTLYPDCPFSVVDGGIQVKPGRLLVAART